MITVNARTISERDVLGEMQYHPADSQQAAMRKAAECLIIGELLRQRAAQLSLHDEAASQDDQLDKLLGIEVQVPEAGEAECRRYFENNRARFVSSPLVAVRHILLLAPPDDARARHEALAIAENLIATLKRGPDAFFELAAAHSRCESAKAGGSLGQLSKGQTVAEFERQVFGAPPGLIGNPVETRYGVHVVRVDHREEGRALPYELVRERVAHYLNEKVRRKAIAHYLQYLISQADIRGYDFGLSPSPLMQ